MAQTRFVVLALALLLSAPAFAKEVAGFDFPETVNAGGHTVKLHGTAIRTKWMFKVYAIAAYNVSGSKEAHHIIYANETKMLWLHFLRGIAGEKMRDTIAESFEKNLTDESSEELKSQVEKFKAAIPENIPKGVDAGFTYIPGRGTSCRFGGREVINIPGQAFMKLLWKVYFGPKPADKGLRRDLLE